MLEELVYLEEEEWLELDPRCEEEEEEPLLPEPWYEEEEEELLLPEPWCEERDLGLSLRCELRGLLWTLCCRLRLLGPWPPGSSSGGGTLW